MATLRIVTGEDQTLPSVSGLGFYGEGGFNFPIPIGGFNGRTFVTDSSGVSQGFEANNIKYFAGTGWGTAPAAVSGAILGQVGSGIALISIPNRLATFNLRFEDTSTVAVQNVVFTAFDGVSLANPQPGVTVYVAELRHTDDIQKETGLGSTVWTSVSGATTLGLISSPGSGGFRPDGPSTISTRHDWFLAMSTQPRTPNDKQFSFAISLEFS